MVFNALGVKLLIQIRGILTALMVSAIVPLAPSSIAVHILNTTTEM